jgi:hypothetical protein
MLDGTQFDDFSEGRLRVVSPNHRYGASGEAGAFQPVEDRRG